MRELMISVGGTFSATLRIEGSVDDVSWHPAAKDASLSLDFTAVGLSSSVAASPVYLRVNYTAWTSGAAIVQVAGGLRRAD
jgi:hypothetical protein